MEINSISQFKALAEQAIIHERLRANGGEIANMTLKNFEYRVRATIIPIFEKKAVAEINHVDILKLSQLLVQRKLSSISIAQYLQDLKKIFNYAEAVGLLEKIPRFPKIKKKSIPRGGFTVGEYRQIIKSSKILSKKLELVRKENHRYTAGGIFARSETVPKEMEYVIRFMVNGFMRPTDVFQIKHKHVVIVKSDYHYLRLELPETKRHSQQIVTLRPAVRLYEKIKIESSKKNFAGPEDYLFFPEIQNRSVAGRLISANFNKILQHANLREGNKGQLRTLYSLRHTAIMFRLLYGSGIDLLTLARNSRTSVQMIEQFYASELKSEMNIGLIQSRRSVSQMRLRP